MNEAEDHHFLSQFYLGGFTHDGTKRGTLYCYDKERCKSWPTNPRNVAYEKHFNRVDAEGVKPTFVEESLSDFETTAAPVLKGIIESHELPRGDELNILFTLIALFGLRNPSIRRAFEAAKGEAARKIFATYLTNDQTWNLFKETARHKGNEGLAGLGLSEARRMFSKNKGGYSITNEAFIEAEFASIEKVIDLIRQRNWLLVVNCLASQFITCDRPVMLTWNFRGQTPMFSPGFDSENSDLTFPISKRLAIVGRFVSSSQNAPTKSEASEETVALFNTRAVFCSARFVYSPTNYFQLLDKKEEITSSRILLREAT